MATAWLAWMRRRWDLSHFLVLVGLALRLYHYARNPAMWHDEAAAVLNVLDKTFRELLGPLEYAEAAPPLFLWLEKLVVLTLGDGTYALRLLPFLASCAALMLFAWLARQVLRPRAVAWAVLIFACNDHLLWHACEAKPYSFDVLAAVCVAALYWHSRAWPLYRRLLIQALLVPIFVFLSYPACFLYGGVLVAFLPTVWRSKQISAWLSYGFFAASVFTSFGLLAVGPVRAQRHEAMDHCWLDAFPPLDRPWAVVPWVVMSTLDIIRYCCEPAGNALAGLLVIGAVSLWRHGRRALVSFFVIPVGLALFASFLRSYPYGGARVLVYGSPAVALLIAEGVPPAWDWLRCHFRLGIAVLLALLLTPAGQVVFRLFVQSGRSDCARAAEYVAAYRQPDEVVTSPAWEARYYFRRLGTSYQSPEDLHPESHERFWLIAVAATVDDRQHLAEVFTSANWHVVRRRDFTRTTVYLLEQGKK
jgi:hypothetical protein